MLRLAVLMVAVAATAKNIQERSSTPQLRYSPAASESQLKFAIENKYDDTGPGAKQPQYAYKTYNNIDDAILAYFNDADTKLPENQKLRAFQKLQLQQAEDAYPKAVGEYENYRSRYPLIETGYNPGKFYHQEPKYNYRDFKGNTGLMHLEQEHFIAKNANAYNHQRLQLVKGSPLSLAHYARVPDLQQAHDQFNPHPKYTYSYGVQDIHTGDTKSAQETRDGGTVRGFYSVAGPDGRLRTVHYTADDKYGYRATVDRADV